VTVFAVENGGDGCGTPVIKRSGIELAELEAIYSGTASEEPALTTVQIRTLERGRFDFGPRVEATVRPGGLLGQPDKKLGSDIPSIDTDGELTADAEPAVYARFGPPAGNAEAPPCAAVNS